VIGSDGKNINNIRDNSGAKIEVFQESQYCNYRQIEISSSVSRICDATEMIYKLVNKYVDFNDKNNTNDKNKGNYCIYFKFKFNYLIIFIIFLCLFR